MSNRFYDQNNVTIIINYGSIFQLIMTKSIYNLAYAVTKKELFQILCTGYAIKILIKKDLGRAGGH